MSPLGLVNEDRRLRGPLCVETPYACRKPPWPLLGLPHQELTAAHHDVRKKIDGSLHITAAP